MDSSKDNRIDRALSATSAIAAAAAVYYGLLCQTPLDSPSREAATLTCAVAALGSIGCSLGATRARARSAGIVAWALVALEALAIVAFCALPNQSPPAGMHEGTAWLLVLQLPAAAAVLASIGAARDARWPGQIAGVLLAIATFLHFASVSRSAR